MLNLSDLTLVAASPEQAKVTRQNTFPQWGIPRGFTMAKYVERDEIMEREEWGADGFLTTWVLVPRSDTETLTEIVSHCETYRRTAVVLAPGSRRAREVIAYGIASVFTPPTFRRRGYGKRMLQLLHYVLAPPSSLPPFPTELFGSPAPPSPPTSRSQDAMFSVLYSDIGPTYYRECSIAGREGWIPQGNLGKAWLLAEDSEPTEEPKGEEEVEWLEREGVKALENGLARKMIEGLEKDKGSGKMRVAFLPNGGLLSLHPLRSLLSDPPNASASRPRTFGFRIPSTDAVCMYTYSTEAGPTEPKTLLITYLAGDIPWSAVKRAAVREGCGRVEIWGDNEVSRGWMGGKGKRIDRDDHLAALCYYGEEEGQNQDSIDWVHNEKYAWC